MEANDRCRQRGQMGIELSLYAGGTRVRPAMRRRADGEDFVRIPRGGEAAQVLPQ